MCPLKCFIYLEKTFKSFPNGVHCAHCSSNFSRVHPCRWPLVFAAGAAQQRHHFGAGLPGQPGRKNDESDEKLYKDVTVILSMYLVILCSATPGFSSTPPNFRPSKLRLERRSSVHPHEILRVMLPQIPTAWH